MPYSTAPDGSARTPGGCRVNNGRCFSAIYYDIVCEVITFEFSDGSHYRTRRGTSLRTYEEWTNFYDPGCTFNAIQHSRPAPLLIPGRSQFFDIAALPPDYAHVWTERASIDDYFKPCVMDDDPPL